MRTLLLIVITSTALVAASSAVDNIIAVPIRAFAISANLPAGRIIYRWDVDLNHDGRKEILLDTKPTQEELKEEEKENGWNPQTADECGFIVYIPNPKGAGYIESKGTDFGTYSARGTGLSVDITQCFVGKVTQLNRWGIVTVDIEPAGRRNPAVATIVAYTLEGDHLKVTNLTKYNPDQDKNNAIYNQYLSKSKRTKVQLQEVTVGK